MSCYSTDYLDSNILEFFSEFAGSCSGFRKCLLGLFSLARVSCKIEAILLTCPPSAGINLSTGLGLIFKAKDNLPKFIVFFLATTGLLSAENIL